MDFDNSREERQWAAVQWLAIVMSIIVYLAFVVYSEFHFYNLVRTMLPPNAQIVGLAAVAVSAITSVALPLADHFWVRVGKQKTLTGLFLLVHLMIVVANLVLDSAIVSGANVNGDFLSMYGTYLLPATVVVYAFGWLMVWKTDSAAERIDEERDLRDLEIAAAQQRRKYLLNARNQAIQQAYGSTAAQEAVNRWAAMNAPRLLAADLGMTAEELPGSDMYAWWPADGEEGAAGRPGRFREPVLAGANGHGGPRPIAASNRDGDD